MAYTVVCPKGRNVFLRVMNAQSKPRELKFGTKVAKFSPLVQSHSKTNSGNCSVKIDNVKDSKNIFKEVINCCYVCRNKKDLKKRRHYIFYIFINKRYNKELRNRIA